MSAFTDHVLEYIQQSDKAWKPKTLAEAMGERPDSIAYALRELNIAKRITRTPLPGHNQFAYIRLGAKASAPVEDSARSPRILWSRAEREQLLVETHRLLRAHRGYSFRNALFEAQQILPEKRRRGHLNSGTLRLMRDTYERMALPEPAAPATENAPPAATPVAEVHAFAAEAKASDDDTASFADPPPDPLGEMLHRLVDAIATNIADQLLDTLTVRINQSLSRLTTTAPAMPSVPKMRFVVAGLKGQQKTEIQAAMPKSTQISFWTVDESPHQLKALCRDADKVFLMTKFVSHSHENMIRSVAADRLVRCNGGVSTLREQMQGYRA